MAMELRVHILRMLGRKGSLPSLLQKRPLGEIISGLEVEESGPSPLKVMPETMARFEPFPLTDMQAAYLLGREAGELHGTGCHLYWEFEHAGWDLERLENAWNKLIARHDMLRAVFLPGGRQQVRREVPFYRLEIHDCRGRSLDDDAGARKELRDRLAHELFEPAVWPLFRVAVSLERGAMRLHIGFDMLIADATSIFQLLSEWADFYDDPTMTARPPELSFRDYVLWRESQKSDLTYQASLEYWRAVALKLPPAPELPMAAVRRTNPPRFRRYEHRMGPSTWEDLQKKAATRGVSPVPVLAAAFAEVLARVAKRSDFTINVTVSNREAIHPQIGEVVGDFSSTLLLMVDCRSRAKFSDRALAVKEQLARDLEHVAVSGVRVLSDLGKTGGPRMMMPFVFTSLLGQSGARQRQAALTRMGGLAWGLTETPQVSLDFQALEDNGSLRISWDVVEGLFAPDLIPAIFEGFVGLVNSLATHDEEWESEWHNLLPAEQKLARMHANDTATAFPAETLHQRVLQQARRTMAATAVVAPSIELTYGEVVGTACLLARQLRAAGVRPNALVAVLLQKGW
jgi:pyochelin synthetase